MLVTSRSASVTGLLPGLCLVGISAGLYFPSGVATLTGLVSHEHWGQTLAVHEMAPNLAFLTAPLLVEALLKFTPWRGILAILGLSAITMAVLFFFFGPERHEKGEAPNPRAIRRILRDLSFWLMAAVFALAVGAESGVYAMLPLFLVNEVGFRRESANTLVGLSRLSGVLILFFSGVITDRIGHKRATVVFLAAMGTLTVMLGLLRGSLITPALMILQATSLPCFFPAALAMISLVFPHHLRSLGVSMIGLVAILAGVGVIPFGIGKLAERLSFSFGFSLLGILILTTLPLISRLQTQKEPG